MLPGPVRMLPGPVRMLPGFRDHHHDIPTQESECGRACVCVLATCHIIIIQPTTPTNVKVCALG